MWKVVDWRALAVDDTHIEHSAYNIVAA
jgi:hypothetical protein